MRVTDLGSIGPDMADVAGGKAAALAELLRAGERVPAGFCVTADAHRRGEMPRAEILAAYERLGGGPVAVRSSAVGEDAADASFAGVFDTVLDVHGPDDVIAAVERCWASAGGPRAAAYVAGVANAASVAHGAGSANAASVAHGAGPANAASVAHGAGPANAASVAGPAGGDGAEAGDGAAEAGAVVAEAGTIRMAVVVQRMVAAEVAGVLFTADPVTGRRTRMLVEAAAGPGPAVVDGRAPVDHYVLDDTAPPAGGCLAPAALAELRAVGERLPELFGAPQDVEWAIDRDGVLWLLQSRPITTLFPAPPATDRPSPRVYFEFGHVQGMLQPATPMGMAGLKTVVAAMLAPLGLRVEITDIGGRLYGDLTDLVRDPRRRNRLVDLMAVDFGPRAQAAMRHVLDDPRFAPRPARAAGRGARGAAVPSADGAAPVAATGPAGDAAPVVATGPAGDAAPDVAARPATGPGLGTAGRAVCGVVRALARPDQARERMLAAIERLRRSAADESPPSRTPAGAPTAAERLRIVRDQSADEPADAFIWPIVAGMLASALPPRLLGPVAEPGEVHAVLGGMPHNVTIEMDLALWRVAGRAAEHRDLLLHTPPAELAARYHRGDLPEFGLGAFLTAYGHRGAAEVDLGVPRWAEDPAPVFAALANYLRLTDREQAPDRRFARAAETAEQTLRELARRARRRRPVRGGLAVWLLGRARRLAGLREAGKFAGLYRLAQMRRHLLLVGADLVAAGLLERPGDIMFLTLDEALTAVQEKEDHRAAIAGRRAWHAREMRRRRVPVALLSDGTDVEALLPAPPDGDALHGVGASAGRATGPARVVLDPATARLEPGEVLVAATTDPGWTPLFLTAAALVTETGAVMAHGPTVAREYGIPAVICVPGATTSIRTGDVVTVDAARGTVTKR